MGLAHAQHAAQGDEWKHEHGWFNNHHWIFPMHPKRFAESSCLKCHHEVAELEAERALSRSARAEVDRRLQHDSPVRLLRLPRDQRLRRPNSRVGPDMRAEPNYSPPLQSAAWPSRDLNEPSERSWPARWSQHPDDDSAASCWPIRIADDGDALRPAMPRQAEQAAHSTSTNAWLGIVLRRCRNAGQVPQGRPQPAARGQQGRLRLPLQLDSRAQDFRPTTKMPQFFGLYDHLRAGRQGLDEQSAAFRAGRRFAAIGRIPARQEPAVRVSRAARRRDEEPRPSAARSCSRRAAAWPAISTPTSPRQDEARARTCRGSGRKLDREAIPTASKWLYSWVRNPNRYHARTVMPNLFLEPIDGRRWQDRPIRPPTSRPTCCVVARTGSRPTFPAAAERRRAQGARRPGHRVPEGTLHRKQAEEYLTTRHSRSRCAGELKGDEVELVGDGIAEQLDKQVAVRRPPHDQQVRLRGLPRYPGFEDAKPIGTGLADWGRKAADKLAFEQIVEYI